MEQNPSNTKTRPNMPGVEDAHTWLPSEGRYHGLDALLAMGLGLLITVGIPHETN